MQINGYLTVSQAAERLGIHRTALYKKIRKEDFPLKQKPRSSVLLLEENLLQQLAPKPCDGRRNNPLYPTYMNMVRRCYNPRCRSYPRYGGRGLTVCDRWKKDFWQFVKDMGNKPTPKHSIGRIDGNKGYSPDNCEWQTAKQQSKEVWVRRRKAR